ncbi:MAG TPA: acyclic terpene utilization AtuA family protein [Caldimonas sp.]|nr:acyclic terpene utilization AtuA family protein [Caldimonas sp.]
MDPATKTLRIGGASGFWGDSSVGAPQLVRSGEIDVLVFDYLAETTMAILAAARRKNAALGYATDFVDVAMRSVLREVAERGIKVVSNAGGIHPQACAAALATLADEQGAQVRIAVVEGDDVLARFVPGGPDVQAPATPGERLLSANAYLGALPIARALDAGADIVVTGRCVDSATTLGPLIHAFGWSETDWDRLAGGSLAGHIIECGCQATGGLHTDWEAVPDWANIGYPIAECGADGSFTIRKPKGTGGLIARAAVAEQLLYEIGDPGAYVLPDVICDWRHVRIEQVDDERVRISGARGRPPTDRYKVSATAMDGWRAVGTLVLVGIDAAAKARRTGEAILARTGRLWREAGFGDASDARVDVLGAETLYGPHARTGATREAQMRVVVDHASREALELFAREIAPAGTSWSPGTTGASGGRPVPSPLIRPKSFMLDKRAVEVSFTLDGERQIVPIRLYGGTARRAPDREPPPPLEADGRGVPMRLIRLAWARSGDKGNDSNIGVVARRAEFLPLLWARLTPEVVRAYFAHLVQGPVERWWLPGIGAINFVLHDALDGGGTASKRIDPLGKGMAQMLLDLEIEVPLSLAAHVTEVTSAPPVL